MKTDQAIQRDVLAELDGEPSVSAAHIGVSVHDGIVTLTGHVARYAEKRAAEEAAFRVAGVRAVVEEIEVILTDPLTRSDADIARAVAYTIEWNGFVPDEAIDVKVEDGTVTLSGEVPWDYQREQALDAVGRLPGVKRLVNRIGLKPMATAGSVKDMIERALERAAHEDADRIHVTVEDGGVTLAGTVRSYAERDAAERAAWSAPGVTYVRGNLTVRLSDYA